MRTLRMSAVAVVVGLSVFAVGCGPAPSTKPADTGKGDKPSGTGPGGNTPTTPGDKAKAAEGEITKRLDPLKAAVAKLKAKIAVDEKEAGGDGTKVLAVAALNELRDNAESLIQQVMDKVKTFKDAKDDVLEAAKIAANVMLDKLDMDLKDYK